MVGKTPTRSTNYDPLFALSSDELKGRSILQNKKKTSSSCQQIRMLCYWVFHQLLFQVKEEPSLKMSFSDHVSAQKLIPI